MGIDRETQKRRKWFSFKQPNKSAFITNLISSNRHQNWFPNLGTRIGSIKRSGDNIVMKDLASHYREEAPLAIKCLDKRRWNQ